MPTVSLRSIIFGAVLIVLLAVWLHFIGRSHRLVYLAQSEPTPYGIVQIRTAPPGDYVMSDLVLSATLKQGCVYDMNFSEPLSQRRERVRLIRKATLVNC